MKISVIIPMYNRWDLTLMTLRGLLIHCVHHNLQIVISDDGSQQNVGGHLDWWRGNHWEDIVHVRVDKNKGFGHACNLGVEKSDGEIVILLSNDVEINGDFIGEILNIFNDKNRPYAPLIAGFVRDYDTGWNVYEGITIPYPEGWLLAFRKLSWAFLGGFDDRYLPFDMEDVDLGVEAKKLGMDLVSLNSPSLYHKSGVTIRSEYGDQARLEQTKKNVEKFKEKWEGQLKEIYKR